MKKIILSIIFLLTFSLGTFAHSSGNITNTCFLWWKKYHAKANVKYLYKYDWVHHKIQNGTTLAWNGQQWVYIPTYYEWDTWEPFWTTTASDVKNSCSSVHADAEWFHNFGGSTGWRVGHGGWKTGPGYSYNVTQYSNHWRIKAGNFDKIENVDKDKFERLNKEGFSKTEINSNILLNDNLLEISNLEGNISIGNNSNFYSTYKVIVYKESKNTSEKEHSNFISNFDNMKYANIVKEGAITISKNNIVLSGFFENSFNFEKFKIDDKNSFGLELSDIDLSINIDDIDLKDDEFLSFALIADGGLDFSSVIIEENNLTFKKLETNNTITTINAYPNPAQDYLNITLSKNDVSYNVNLYNLNGQKIVLNNKGTSTGLSINTDNIPNGTYFLELIENGKFIETKKIIIKH